MILQALEHRYQSLNGKTEPLMTFDWSQLQIEHIMPQKWESHWPLLDDLSAEERKSNVQGIGNLTLVSKKLNPSLSNGPWFDTEDGKPGKRSGLHAHTILRLNKSLIDTYDNWSDASIDERAEQLFDDAKQIWPR
jgi:hypothetical protein